MKPLTLAVLTLLFAFAVPALKPAFAEISSYEKTVQNIKTPKELSKFLKKNFKFVSDQKLFGVEDYWQTPEEFWKNKKGDCEDYALFTKAVLEKLGYEAYTISLYSGGYAHTVTIYSDQGRFNVFNEDRVYRYAAANMEQAITRIFPQWTWAAIARIEGTRGWLVREIQNPA